MGWFVLAKQILKIVFFFLDLWREKDEKKAAMKAELAKEVVDAFKETDKEKRASKLNVAIGHVNRMR